MELSSEDEVRIVGFTPNQSALLRAPPSPTWVVEDIQARVASLRPPETIPVELTPSYSHRLAESIHLSDDTSSETPPDSPPSPPSIVNPRTSRRPFTQPSNRKLMPETGLELKKLCDILTCLSQQFHVLSQRRIAERAAANVSEDGPKPETCPICFENFHCPGTCTTRCGHVFHRRCLDICLKSSKSCPVCRSSIHKAELVDLMSGFGETVKEVDAVVDLINEPNKEEHNVLDECLLTALKSVRELIDQSKAVDKLACKTKKENDMFKVDMAYREKQLESAKANFKKVMKQREGELKKRTTRIMKTEEVIREKHEELNKALCDLRDKETALQIRQAEVEAEYAKSMKIRDELEKEKDSMREKERRMIALQEAHKHRKARERDEGTQEKIAMLEQLLRSKGISIPTEHDRDRRQEVDKRVFKVDVSDEVTIVESPVKRRKVIAPAKSAFESVFGGGLKKPSAYSRPQAPRRKNIGVKSFAPERRTVQRPNAVAKRGLHCISKG